MDFDKEQERWKRLGTAFLNSNQSQSLLKHESVKEHIILSNCLCHHMNADKCIPGRVHEIPCLSLPPIF